MSIATQLSEMSAELKQRERELSAAKAAAAAIRWFAEYGDVAKSDTSFAVHFTCASKCVGADKGLSYLESAAQGMLDEVYARALEMARADLARVFPQ